MNFSNPVFKTRYVVFPLPAHFDEYFPLKNIKSSRRGLLLRTTLSIFSEWLLENETNGEIVRDYILGFITFLEGFFIASPEHESLSIINVVSQFEYMDLMKIEYGKSTNYLFSKQILHHQCCCHLPLRRQQY